MLDKARGWWLPCGRVADPTLEGNTMSTDERISRLSTAEKAALTSGSNFWHTTAVGDIPAVMMTDGPHGIRKQTNVEGAGLLDSEPATCFPPAVTLASTWDPGLV